jgi:catechol 2,3-dioxygenase-like lactoylglutathione lyase family enzyme
MLANNKAFSGFAVDDIAKAREFYGETLGLRVDVIDEENQLLALHHPGDRDTLVYGKPDHAPANYTILNFEVDDIDMPQDEKGVLRGREANQGPDIAWFTDPAGNILSVLQQG